MSDREECNSTRRAEPAGRDNACTVCAGKNVWCGHCEGMWIEPRKLVGYGDCRCVLSKYCDGKCNPIWADELACRSRVQGGHGEAKDATGDSNA